MRSHRSEQRAAYSEQISAVRFALFALLCALPSLTLAQGVLPPKTSTATVTSETKRFLSIGDKVPETFRVTGENGKSRGLLTYKSALDVMVVGFFSSTCPDKISRWIELERFYEDYKGWGVAFVAINAGEPQEAVDLRKRMDKAGLPFPLLAQEDHLISEAFKVGSVPFLVILDESGDLRYRGPPGKDARQAVEAVIGHMVPVPNPQPLTQEECSVQ